MAKSYPPRWRLARLMVWLQLILGGLIVIVSISNLARFYHAGFFFHSEDICHQFHGPKDERYGFDVKALSGRIEEVLEKMETLQNKLEAHVQKMEEDKDHVAKHSMSRLEFKRYLEGEVVEPLYDTQVALRQIRLPKVGPNGSATVVEEPLINTFMVEEIRKYITPKKNKNGKVNVFRTERIHNTIGHACVLMKKDLEAYMDYNVGSYCNDDWNLAHKLMLQGCDPLPRRRCLTRASKVYLKPYPVNESLWKIPDGRNVRWNLYKCRDFKCLSSNNTNSGYTECTQCFDMDLEMLKWVNTSSVPPVDFLIRDVLAVKPGEIRIGIDYSVGTGSFAARMKEQSVTIISTALNLGAPFSEVIALRGLLHLYITPNQRLPFFENTMDLIHTTGVLDGWIDLVQLDFMLFDWDRVLRPGGLLWIDKFFCNKKDLDDYMYLFLQFRYKKHKWVVSSKSKDKVYLSALLEKTRRSLRAYCLILNLCISSSKKKKMNAVLQEQCTQFVYEV